MRPRCNAWPALLLVTALATVFPFLSEWGPLYRLGVGHDHITFNSLAVARNYSAEHGWRRFEALTVNDDGERAYLMYYRFPPLGNVSIKLAVSTQNGDWRGEVQAARLLMLAFYAGAAMLAYFSLVALTQRRWRALAATLTAFASGVALYTSDMVSSEGSVGLFSTMLAFHGICRYYGAKAGSTTPNATPRFGQMLAKTCVALLLGWHVLGLLAPFVGLGMAAAFAAKDWPEFRRLLLFGTLALLFGMAVLAWNFAWEYFGRQGQDSLWNLPSFAAMRRRSGLSPHLYALSPDVFPRATEVWRAFAESQLHRIGLALAPYSLSRFNVAWAAWPLLGALGLVAVVGGAWAALAARSDNGAARRHAVAACLALALASLCWAIGMRGTLHGYLVDGAQCLLAANPSCRGAWDISLAMYCVGVPLALFALFGLAAPGPKRTTRGRAVRRRATTVAAVAALWLAFVASGFHIGRLHRDAGVEELERAVLADVDVIRRLTAGKVVFAPGPVWPDGPQARARQRYYFSGHVLVFHPFQAFADFATGPRILGAHTLTPDNQTYFLYPIDEYHRLCGAPMWSPTAPDLQRWCRLGRPRDWHAGRYRSWW